VPAFRERVVETDAGRRVQLVEWLWQDPALDDGAEARRALVLFVHGSPGSWTAAKDLFAERKLRRGIRLMSLDRLGWGGSAAGGVEPSLQVQAEAVAACIRSASPRGPVVLVGHSLGGPVIVRTAMDFPSLVQGLVILAGSVDPALEKTTWYQAVGRWPWVRWMVPRMLRRSDAEIIGLRSQLEEMLPMWGGVELPVAIVHGERDRLVPVANVEFMQRVLTAAKSVVVHRISGRGHFLPWKESQLVADTVVTMLERLSGS